MACNSFTISQFFFFNEWLIGWCCSSCNLSSFSRLCGLRKSRYNDSQQTCAKRAPSCVQCIWIPCSSRAVCINGCGGHFFSWWVLTVQANPFRKFFQTPVVIHIPPPHTHEIGPCLQNSSLLVFLEILYFQCFNQTNPGIKCL